MTAKKILTVFLLVLMMSALLVTTASAAEETAGITLPTGEVITADTLLTGNLGATFSTVVIVFAVVGLLEALFGYSLLRLELVLGGFGAGAFLGNFLATGLLKTVIPAGTVTYMVMLVLGVIGALLAFKLFRLAVFLGVGFAGYTIAKSMLVPLLGLAAPIDIIAAVAVGVILGALALVFLRPIVILVTSLMGAFLVSFALSGIIPVPYINIILLAVVFLLGLLIQCRRARGKH